MNAKVAFNIQYDQSDATSDFLAINSQSGVISTRLNILSREMRNVTVSNHCFVLLYSIAKVMVQM